jgi:hypothetical protein
MSNRADIFVKSDCKVCKNMLKGIAEKFVKDDETASLFNSIKIRVIDEDPVAASDFDFLDLSKVPAFAVTDEDTGEAVRRADGLGPTVGEIKRILIKGL